MTDSQPSAPEGTTLFVSFFVPWAKERDRHGVFQRMRLLLDSLAQCSSRVRVLLIGAKPDPELEDKCVDVQQWMQAELGSVFEVRVVPCPGSNASVDSQRTPLSTIRAAFGESPLSSVSALATRAVMTQFTEGRPSLVFAHRIEAFAAIRRAPIPASVPLLFDLDDIEHIAFARFVLSPPYWKSKRLRLVHVLPLLWEEILAMHRCAAVLVCSEADARKLHAWSRSDRARVISNAVADPGPRCNDASARPIAHYVLFVGTYHYPPNRIGIEWFMREVWPIVRRRDPSLRLRLVGRGTSTLTVPTEISTTVDVLDFVDDLSAQYADASAVICPILSGGGTRIKLIEAAAHRCAIVSTSVGAEGLEFERGAAIRISDTPSDFADEIVAICSDSSLRLRLGSAARDAYAIKYRRESVIQDVIGLVLGCMCRLDS